MLHPSRNGSVCRGHGNMQKSSQSSEFRLASVSRANLAKLKTYTASDASRSTVISPYPSPPPRVSSRSLTLIEAYVRLRTLSYGTLPRSKHSKPTHDRATPQTSARPDNWPGVHIREYVCVLSHKWQNHTSCKNNRIYMIFP